MTSPVNIRVKRFLSVLVSQLVSKSVRLDHPVRLCQPVRIFQSVKPISSVKVKQSVKLVQLNFDF